MGLGLTVGLCMQGLVILSLVLWVLILSLRYRRILNVIIEYELSKQWISLLLPEAQINGLKEYLDKIGRIIKR